MRKVPYLVRRYSINYWRYGFRAQRQAVSKRSIRRSRAQSKAEKRRRRNERWRVLDVSSGSPHLPALAQWILDNPSNAVLTIKNLILDYKALERIATGIDLSLMGEVMMQLQVKPTVDENTLTWLRLRFA